MQRDDLSTHMEPIQALLIAFSAVSLGAAEFIRHVLPDKDVLAVPTSAVVYTLLLVLVLPTVVLFLGDRLIASADQSGRALRIYRTMLFAGAIALFLRQLWLYSDPGQDLAAGMASISPAVAAAVVVVALALLGWLCGRLYRGLALFFYYMSPLAIAMTAILPYRMEAPAPLPAGYEAEVVRAAPSPGRPPVFIFVFDELSYEVLAKGEEIDAASFPNLAALAGEGAWFTNATASQFYTHYAVPELVDAVVPLADRFDLRLYLQYGQIASHYEDGCGKAFTCRGVRYLAEKHPALLAANLALRAAYEAMPEALEKALAAPLGRLVNGLGSTYPPADPDGVQIYSKKQFDLFLRDISRDKAPGRIYLLHSLLTHFPFAFTEAGKASRSPFTYLWVEGANFDAVYKNYRRQAMYADAMLGAFRDKLKRERLYDDAVIILTADHGLRPSEVVSDPIEVGSLTTHIPLLIRAPGISSHVSGVDYQPMDFGPTLVDVLGLPPLAEAPGVSALSMERPAREKVFYVDSWAYFYSPEYNIWRLTEFVQDSPVGEAEDPQAVAPVPLTPIMP